jgi:hypothetical protein
MRKLMFALCFPLLYGCAANQATLVVYSQPSAAYILNKNGEPLGTAPVKINYNSEQLKRYKDASGCFLVQGVNAVWVSGSRNNSNENIRLCGAADGVFNFTINRRMSDDGLDKDMDFAMRADALRAQQEPQIFLLLK